MNLNVELPELLEPLFHPKRYKVLHGGRGSSKSWSVARALLVKAASGRLRVLCGREIQKSIKDSVHRLLKDQIEAIGIPGYTVLDTEIRHANGSVFLFTGLSEHTVDSIKSFEGVDICWLEEAQTITKRSWDVLIPTIRKPGSELWLTLNPDMETDETYVRFVATPSPDTWVQAINWRSNPWFPDVLNDERLKFKERDPDNYDNVWEGVPKRVSEGAIYAAEVQAMYADGRVCAVPHDPVLIVDTVWDLGWNDSMSIGMYQRSASSLRAIDYIEDSGKTLDWYVRELERRPYRYGTDFIPHDGAARDFKTGKSTQELLKSMRRKVKVLERLSVEEGIRAARTVFPRFYADQTKCARLMECLKRYRRSVSTRTDEPMGPLHDQFSHGADVWRYTAQAVERMGKIDREETPPVRPWRPLDNVMNY